MMKMMKWSLAFLASWLPLISAREQHTFSLDSLKGTTITPLHAQPWCLSISQNPLNADCLVISSPEQTQAHKWIQGPGDVLVLNKTFSGGAAVEKVDEYLLEIIGYDKRILWQEASRLCAAIEYPESTQQETFAEFEVTKIHYSGNPANRVDFVMMGDGYTEGEKKKFYADVERMTDDLFKGDTFKSILPVLSPVCNSLI